MKLTAGCLLLFLTNTQNKSATTHIEDWLCSMFGTDQFVHLLPSATVVAAGVQVVFFQIIHLALLYTEYFLLTCTALFWQRNSTDVCTWR